VRHWQAKNNAILAGFALLFHLVLSRVLDHPKVIGILQIVNAAVFSMWFLSMSVLKRGALPEVMKAHFTGTSHLHDFRRRPHMLVLPAFSHADRKHIMGNLGTLQLVGSFILPIIGHREFAQVYSAGAIGGSLLECLFPPLLVRLGLSDSINAEASARSLGASGAITAMVMYACLLEPRATFETKIPFLSDKEQEYPLAVCGAALVAADAYGATRRKGEVRLGDTVEVPDVDNPERIVEVKVLKVRKSATGARFYTVYDEETDEKWRVNEEDVETSSSNVGHTAHLAGASVGLAMFLVNRAIPKAYRHVHRRAVVLHRRMSRRKSRRRRR
jgi:membrane associated rhomboid family serine protease